LIAAILNQRQLRSFIQTAATLGLTALVEIHNLPELDKALSSGARLLGVNNRNLKNFKVDINTSLKLKQKIPETIPVISESGISSTAHIKLLKDKGFSGVLIGESFLKDYSKMVNMIKYGKN
ncbi:MAG TPA: indole-3-glycerol-phosphate synthase TrpC, partial [Spirochaetota bacterium]|nr:indole-3-glycerol-phosphate synthase TrpC [Spirochaetota bacterium]